MKLARKLKWFIPSTIIAPSCFIGMPLIRDLSQKGTIDESRAAALVMFAMNLAGLSTLVAVSFFIYLFVKDKPAPK